MLLGIHRVPTGASYVLGSLRDRQNPKVFVETGSLLKILLFQAIKEQMREFGVFPASQNVTLGTHLAQSPAETRTCLLRTLDPS